MYEIGVSFYEDPTMGQRCWLICRPNAIPVVTAPRRCRLLLRGVVLSFGSELGVKGIQEQGLCICMRISASNQKRFKGMLLLSIYNFHPKQFSSNRRSFPFFSIHCNTFTLGA